MRTASHLGCTGKVLRGALAGAAGTTALNLVTYLDMSARGRPASTTPQETIRRMEEVAGTSVAEDADRAENRRTGLGTLLGHMSGVGTGVALALVRHKAPRLPTPVVGVLAGVAVNIASVGPMAGLGVTDPRQWSTESWVSDVIPHMACGITIAVTYDLLVAR